MLLKYLPFIVCLLLNASLSFAQSPDDSNLAHLQVELETAKHRHNLAELSDIYKRLTDLEKRKGHYESSLNYIQQWHRYQDSIYAREREQTIASVKERYETEKKSQVIQLLDRELKIQRLWKNIMIAGSVLLTVIALLLHFLVRYRENKNRQIFNLQLKSLSTQHRELEERYKVTLAMESGVPDRDIDRDESELKKVIDAVERNIGSSTFGVEELSKEVGMSRTNLHRKIKAITGFPPGELVRSIRLRRAAVMLLNQVDSVTQIAIKVGFDDQSYFSKLFKKEFGMSPSEYMQSGSNNDNENDEKRKSEDRQH